MFGEFIFKPAIPLDHDGSKEIVGVFYAHGPLYHRPTGVIMTRFAGQTNENARMYQPFVGGEKAGELICEALLQGSEIEIRESS
ncbi:hypothetical protein M1116_03435 [Patescibacteria group bacterium]|nr:hypothetical protein [Patescibacteria group bacterium]